MHVCCVHGVCVCVWLCARARVRTGGQIFSFICTESRQPCIFMHACVRACVRACACACACLLCMYACACECVLRVYVWACLGTGGHEHRRQRAIIRWNYFTVKLRVQWASFLWIGLFLFFFPFIVIETLRVCMCSAVLVFGARAWRRTQRVRHSMCYWIATEFVTFRMIEFVMLRWLMKFASIVRWLFEWLQFDDKLLSSWCLGDPQSSRV